MLFVGVYSPAAMGFGGNYRPGRPIVKSVGSSARSSEPTLIAMEVAQAHRAGEDAAFGPYLPSLRAFVLNVGFSAAQRS